MPPREPDVPTTEQVKTFCPLCVSRCGATATITDGEFVALGPDPDHPTGQALCVKGKAAPDIVRHPTRLLHPLRRTNPKGADDPGWEQISWDEAEQLIADRLNAIKAEHGAEAVLFSNSSPSCTSISDAIDWVVRLRRAFGSPNYSTYMELCGWGRYFASSYTFGAPVPGAFMPDLERAGCILYWAYNPSVARLVHATQTASALRNGAKLVVVDPRRAGFATKADQWLRVQPGADAALALSIAHVMIDRGWFDRDFVTHWTGGPLLVREDTGRLLRAADVDPEGNPDEFLAWDVQAEAVTTTTVGTGEQLALRGTFEVNTLEGPVSCSPSFELLAQRCAVMAPTTAAEITGVPAEQIEETARVLWEHRPVAFYTWSGLEMQSNATQTLRAITVLYALTGSIDVPGGNVFFTPVPSNPVDGPELLPDGQRAKAVGLEHRPLGGARFEFSANEDLFTAMLEERPYRLRGMVNFGANHTMANGDSRWVRDALTSLDFFVHADLFMNPTAELADIVLPVTSAWEAEALRIGFEVSQEAVSHVQLRQPVAARRGEARSDLEIIFGLAERLGLGEHFFDGDIETAWRHQLKPSGLTLEQLRDAPGGINLASETRHRKYATSANGGPAGFRTGTGRVDLYSEAFLGHGYDPLPVHVDSSISHAAHPEWSQQFPLTLTGAKSLHFCETQHRQVERLRSRARDPEVEIHPDTAAARGIGKGDWVRIDTPFGHVRARAVLDGNLDPDVVVGQHGWWQGCDALGIPDEPPYEDGGTNLNMVLPQSPSDPISGSPPLRASVCQLVLANGKA